MGLRAVQIERHARRRDVRVDERQEHVDPDWQVGEERVIVNPRGQLRERRQYHHPRRFTSARRWPPPWWLAGPVRDPDQAAIPGRRRRAGTWPPIREQSFLPPPARSETIAARSSRRRLST